MPGIDYRVPAFSCSAKHVDCTSSLYVRTATVEVDRATPIRILLVWYSQFVFLVLFFFRSSLLLSSLTQYIHQYYRCLGRANLTTHTDDRGWTLFGTCIHSQGHVHYRISSWQNNITVCVRVRTTSVHRVKHPRYHGPLWIIGLLTPGAACEASFFYVPTLWEAEKNMA